MMLKFTSSAPASRVLLGDLNSSTTLKWPVFNRDKCAKSHAPT